jgi:hypothetical protein
MVIDGTHVRFCQQCGRFQPLSDFHKDRKTCKKKLAIHNNRRKQSRSVAQLQNSDEATGSAERATSSRLLGFKRRKSIGDLIDNTASPANRTSTATNSSDAMLASGNGGAIEEENDFSGAEVLLTDTDFDLDVLLNQLDANAAAQLSNTHLLPPLESLIAPLEADLTSAARAPHNGVHTAVQFNAVQPNVLSHAVSVHPHPSLQLTEASSLLNANKATLLPAEFPASSDLVRVSFKLFNVHPHELPASIYEELKTMMNVKVSLKKSNLIYLLA